MQAPGTPNFFLNSIVSDATDFYPINIVEKL